MLLKTRGRGALGAGRRAWRTGSLQRGTPAARARPRRRLLGERQAICSAGALAYVEGASKQSLSGTGGARLRPRLAAHMALVGGPGRGTWSGPWFGVLVGPDGHNGVRGEKARRSAPVPPPGTSVLVVIEGDPAVLAQDLAGSAEQSPQLPVRFVAARNGYIGITPTGKIVLEEGRPHRVGKK